MRAQDHNPASTGFFNLRSEKKPGQIFLAGRRWKISRRDSPLYWFLITPKGIASRLRFRDWELVLSARRIDYFVLRRNGRLWLYVSPTLAPLARAEMAAYDREATRKAPAPQPFPSQRHAAAILFLMPALILAYGQEFGWWAMPFAPAGEALRALGKLDGIATGIYQQWWRLATALTLHADISHLVGNLCFGAFFLVLLARSCGPGRALLLAILGGIAGNFISWLVHDANYASVGFSTAIFAAIGALAGIVSCQAQSWRGILPPIAAGVALLALLGAEGGKTDYAAHIAGLCCGVAFGFIAGWSQRLNWRQPPQWLAASLALGLLAGAWLWALSHDA